MLKYTTDQGWIYQNIEPTIRQEGEEICRCQFYFQWPSWAIQEVNRLGGDLNAIKQISEQLKKERINAISTT